MKLKEFVSVTNNKRNNQINLGIKKKELKKLGMTPEQLLESTLLKPKKFIK